MSTNWGPSIGGNTWEPMTGERIRGTITPPRTVETVHGPKDVVTVTDANGTGYDIWVNANLKNGLSQANVNPGNEIGIIYHGKQPTEQGNFLSHVYEVHLLGPGTATNGGGAQQPPTPQPQPQAAPQPAQGWGDQPAPQAAPQPAQQGWDTTQEEPF